MRYKIRSEYDLAETVQEYGFLPMMRNRIEGFSVEDLSAPDVWFVESVDGPWEWKGPVINDIGCAYGKFFASKAGFVSWDWYCDFANYRRGGCDFLDRKDDSDAGYLDRVVYEALVDSVSLISREWRQLVGMQRRGEFDSVVTRLQMQGYVVTTDFEYATDRNGNPYGWGLSRYSTPELHFGYEFSHNVYKRSPEESYARMEAHLRRLLPRATDVQIKRILEIKRPRK